MYDIFRHIKWGLLNKRMISVIVLSSRTENLYFVLPINILLQTGNINQPG